MRTPEQKAAESVAAGRREVAELEALAKRLDAIEDLAAWEHKRADAEHLLEGATRHLSLARAEAGASSAELDKLQQRLDAARRHVEAAKAPPPYKRVSREDDILAALSATPKGGHKVGNDKKEAAVDAIFRSLDVPESRVLAQRLRLGADGDPVVAVFRRLTAERRERLMATLQGAQRRAALAASVSQAAPSPSVADAEPASEVLADNSPMPADILRLDDDRERSASPIPTATGAKASGPTPAMLRAATKHYLRDNSNPLQRSLSAHLRATTWPGHERYQWKNTAPLAQSIALALASAGEQIDELLYPHSASDVIAELLPMHEDDGTWKFARHHWVEAVGARLGQIAQAVVTPSVRRMTTRAVDVVDARAAEDSQRLVHLDAHDLIASNPRDQLV